MRWGMSLLQKALENTRAKNGGDAALSLALLPFYLDGGSGDEGVDPRRLALRVIGVGRRSDAGDDFGQHGGVTSRRHGKMLHGTPTAGRRPC